MKAVGQGLGYDLRRISFVAGDWLNCCSLSKEDDDIGSRLRWCSCPRTSAATTAAAAAAVPGRLLSGGDSDAVERGGKASGGGRPDTDRNGINSWGLEDRAGCVCGVGEAAVEVSYVPGIYAKSEPEEGGNLCLQTERYIPPIRAQKVSHPGQIIYCSSSPAVLRGCAGSADIVQIQPRNIRYCCKSCRLRWSRPAA